MDAESNHANYQFTTANLNASLQHNTVRIGQFRQIHRIFCSPDRKFIECMECDNAEWQISWRDAETALCVQYELINSQILQMLLYVDSRLIYKKNHLINFLHANTLECQA